MQGHTLIYVSRGEITKSCKNPDEVRRITNRKLELAIVGGSISGRIP